MAAPKQSNWHAKRTGSLNKFYTRTAVGELLTEALGAISPQTVVDLGAGEGSLSRAVARKWPHVSVTTVDIDDACVEALHQGLLDDGVASHQHRHLNVLDSDLPTHLNGAHFDLVVSNPPFYRPAWDRAFARILQAAHFSNACPTVADATAEVLFFAQALRLVREGGSIAFIVPDGLATSWRALSFRKALLEQHTLVASIQLPPYSFVDTEAYCFILIVTKKRDAEDRPVKLLRLHEDASVSQPILIDHDAATTRLDWLYHSTVHPKGNSPVTLRGLGAEVRRGSLSTVERRKASFPVFHTGDFPAPGELIRLPTATETPADRKLVIAEAGDILMARVDRDLHQKVTLVLSGQTAITDCLYRVRLPEEHRYAAFHALSSEEGRARIQAVTKGVGARLLGKGELLDLPLNIVS